MLSDGLPLSLMDMLGDVDGVCGLLLGEGLGNGLFEPLALGSSDGEGSCDMEGLAEASCDVLGLTVGLSLPLALGD